MPKKFQGTNTKAVEARARKAEKLVQEKEQKLKAAEDEYWKDDDKVLAKKQQRKQQQEQKKLENLKKKKEIQELYNAEQESVGKSAKPSTAKVTRADIDANKRREEKIKAEQLEEAKLEKKNISVQNTDLEENINKAISKGLSDESAVEARSVEEAISVLSTSEELDRHPERRLKASFKKFEQEHLPVLKAQNPSMRMSQLRQVLRKEWQKSPENPLNQAHKVYNAK